MAKKNFGKFLALAALSGAVAAGVSYFLKYQSFHKELDEDFHDFEGEGEQEEGDSFDGTLPHEAESRSYVTLGEKKADAPDCGKDAAPAEDAGEEKETPDSDGEKESSDEEKKPEASGGAVITEDTGL